MREKILEIIKQAGRSGITTLEIYSKLSPACSIISVHLIVHKLADDRLIELTHEDGSILRGGRKQIRVKIKKESI